MRIARLETLRTDAGWRSFSFLKITTDDGLVGWSEFNESFGSAGLAAVIDAIAPSLIGRDPTRFEAITAWLHVLTRQSRGGINQQAIAAIENAVLDIAARARGIPVCALFGGPVRERIPVYWSHFASYRVSRAAVMGVPAIVTREDVARHAVEVRDAGFAALKTNILVPGEDGALVQHAPGFGRGPGWPELNWDNALLHDLREHLRCIRDAVGPRMGIHLDTNFHFKTEGFLRVADAVAEFDLTWLELDTHDAPSLARIRANAPCPIASCETLHGRREFLPFLAAGATDVAIVDVIWNGLAESLKIASLCDVHEVNCAPHNFYGNLSTAISAHFAAAIPNLRVMELDLDSVAWRDEFTTPPIIENGALLLPDAPGWGVHVNEAAIRARPIR